MKELTKRNTVIDCRTLKNGECTQIVLLTGIWSTNPVYLVFNNRLKKYQHKNYLPNDKMLVDYDTFIKVHGDYESNKIK